jgi:hypothetical protein
MMVYDTGTRLCIQKDMYVNEHFTRDVPHGEIYRTLYAIQSDRISPLKTPKLTIQMMALDIFFLDRRQFKYIDNNG